MTLFRPSPPPLAFIIVLLGLTPAQAQAPVLPPGDKEPVLRLEPGGPTTYVTSLAFNTDGTSLYAAGFDKVVRVWVLDRQTGEFVLDPAATYRIPIGPGIQGSINEMGISPDGGTLAVAGMSIFRGNAGFRQPGLVFPGIGGLSPLMRRDQGTIYLFDTRTRAVRVLRGHQGPIWTLSFLPGQPGKPNTLVSAAYDWNDAENQREGVVRVWNADTGDSLGVLRGLPKKAVKPALAAWHTGPRAAEVRVAIAWNDGLFRLWQVDQGDQGVRTAEDGSNNVSAVFQLAGSRLVTGSVRRVGNQDVGHLQLWTAPDGRAASPVEGGLASLDPEAPGANVAPRTLRLLSSTPGGPIDTAALAVLAPDMADAYFLKMIDLRRGHFGEVRSSVPLWKGGRNRPTLAAAPGGEYIAAAGNATHSISVFKIADLFADRPQPNPQKIVSRGENFRTVAFAVRGKDVGLVLNARGKKALGAVPEPVQNDDLVFDVTHRKLSDLTAGWAVSFADPAGWSAKLGERKGDGTPTLATVTVAGPNGQPREIVLEPRQAVTDYAILPPRAPLNTALIAVAVYAQDLGEPKLLLYNAETGDLVRQFTGHTEPIRCVSFAADGKLLVSAADDQTVAVWTLSTLPAILGNRGLLTGVAVKDRAGEVVVGEIRPDSPAAGSLAKDDVIEGLVVDKKLTPFRTPREFYDAVSAIKPGTKATFRVGGKGDLALTVGQGADDRKPLLSLFVTRGKTADAREWVGWNPLGPYESSDRQAERHIGWHFNTGKPDAPTAFARADEYRKQYYREGILRHLVTEAGLTPALKAWDEEDKKKKLPVPKMGLWIDELGPDPRNLDGKGQVVVLHRPVTLKLAVDDIPADRVAVAAWRINDADAKLFSPTDGRERTADLTPFLTVRGIYRVRATIRTTEGTPQEYTREMTIRFQPPPVIRFDPAWLKAHFPNGESTRLVVRDKPQLPIEAEVETSFRAEDVAVTVRAPGDNQPKESARRIKRTVDLKPGDNVIEIMARPVPGLAGYEETETSRKMLIVRFEPKNAVPAPRVQVTKVVPVGADPVTVVAGEPVIVDRPKVRLVGTVHSDEPLESLRVAGKRAAGVGRGVPPRPDVRFDEEVELGLGSQVLTVVAATAMNQPAVAAVTLDYRPPLPKVIVLSPANGLVINADAEPADNVNDLRDILVESRLVLPAESRPFKAVLLQNNAEVPDAVTADPAAGRLTAKVRLTPGPNRLQIRLSNEWQRVETTPDIEVRYVRPPKFADEPKAVTSERPFATLDFKVRTATPLVDTSVEAEVNGRTVTGGQVLRPTEEEPDVWRVRLKDVPLDVGTNRFWVWVSNREARSREPATGVVVYRPAPQVTQRPRVEILDPAADANVTDPDIMIRFRVKSAVPLRRVEVVRDDTPPVRTTVPLETMTQDKLGFYEATARVGLVPRANRVRIEAVNAGGIGQAEVVVNALAMPVRLELDRLEVRADAGDSPALVPAVQPDGRILFGPAPTGVVVLRGRVTWAKETDEQLKAVRQVRVTVNGFQQAPALLKPYAEGSRERSFEAELFLGRAAGNKVHVDLPELPQDAGNRREFSIDCRDPQHKQRLHLLLVSVGSKDRDALTRNALRMLDTRTGDDTGLTSPQFERVQTYGPLTDFVSPDEVITQLRLIKNSLDLRAGDGSPKDVVVVYFQGAQTKKADGTFFETSTTEFDPDLRRSGITCEGLRGLFAETLGAKVLLLDVADRQDARSPGEEIRDQVANWPQEMSVGVMRLERNGTSPPGETGLIARLDAALRVSATLSQATRLVSQPFLTQSGQAAGRVSFHDKVPTTLQELRLRKSDTAE